MNVNLKNDTYLEQFVLGVPDILFFLVGIVVVRVAWLLIEKLIARARQDSSPADHRDKGVVLAAVIAGRQVEEGTLKREKS